MPRLARQLLRLLRLPALAVLLLAVLANPVLAAVGDLHEAARGHATHLDHPPETHAADDEAAIDGDGATGDLLHALMHGVHCCGHATPLPVAFVSFSLTPVPATVPRTHAVLPVSAAQASPIRPPISG